MKVLSFMMVTLVTASSLLGQPREGKNKELSLSGSYQNYSTESSTGSSSAFIISPRLGFFVFNGFEIEPEIWCMLIRASDPVYMLNGNISYNFISGGNTVPFLLIGYGLANAIPFLGLPIQRTDFKIDVLNIGGGVKVFLREDIALRIEYRYQRFTGEGEMSTYGYYSYSLRVDTRIHTVQFGLSILL
jgi:opacity protein-like surface antigen